MTSIPTANTPAGSGITRDWFREWFDSPFYHKLYFERNQKEAADFIHRLLALLMPPAGSFLLDVACGRGRHARILSEAGYDVTGIDLAPGSIAFANQFADEHLHFFVHDMRHLLCTNCFDYAFNFFTSFGYFETQREHLNAVHTIGAALRPKGIFVLDYLNAPHVRANLVPNEVRTMGDTTYTITRWCDGKHFYKRIVISDRTLTSPLAYTEKVAVFLPKDFEALFEPNGLRIRQLYGDYALDPYDPERSPRLLIIADKIA